MKIYIKFKFKFYYALSGFHFSFEDVPSQITKII